MIKVDYSLRKAYIELAFSVGIFGSKFDTFKKKFIEQLHNGAPTTITNTGERFYKLVYDTLCKIYNIN